MSSEKIKQKLASFKAEIDKVIDSGEFIELIAKEDCRKQMLSYLEEFRKFTQDGKRIRPFLVSFGYEMTAGKYDSRIIMPALAFEIFQSGILIHDDIIDASDTRRGKPCMHKTIGEAKAICVGDFGFMAAVDACARSEFEPSLVIKAVRHLSHMIELTIAGEIKDVELSETDDFSEEDILNMYRLKTAWYTMTGPMQLGAILGGADEKLLSDIEKIGTSMGTAFQIVDDIIGIFGTKETIGKSNLSDMNEGKKTVLYSHFMAHADENMKKGFSEVYGTGTGKEAELEKVRKMFTDAGSLDYSKALCRKYVDEAEIIINEMSISDECKETLHDFLDYLCVRNF